MDLKELPVQDGNGARANRGRTGQRLLYCTPCRASFSLPPTGVFEPAEEECPACGMQAIWQRSGNGYNGRDRKLCPNCQNNSSESNGIGR